jgi:hypothetical protein
MTELIQQYAEEIEDSSGTRYKILAYGEARPDGNWEGWLEFHPTSAIGGVLRTGRETTQPNRQALAYWASGLEPLYFEGALARAR